MTYRVYEESFSVGPEFHFTPGTVNNYDDWWTVRGGFRTDWTLGTRDTVTFQGDMFASREGEQTSIAVFNPPSEINPIFQGPCFWREPSAALEPYPQSDL